MKRKALANLTSWFREPQRKPLVIRGARQVGKSTLVRQFAKSIGMPLVEINLERYPHLDEVFQSLNVEKIVDALENLPRLGRISSSRRRGRARWLLQWPVQLKPTKITFIEARSPSS